jgi:drug/metabolite transporter (DMT)-like permease
VGVVLGVVFLNELLDWQLFVGGAMVVGSIVLVNKSG